MSGFAALALLVAAYVGVTVGGSSTAVAFGPAVGSDSVGRYGAAALMTAFVLLGGWTAGREVVTTVGSRIVPAEAFTVPIIVAVTLVVGSALLLANRLGVPASTSMTVVSAIAGFGAATGTLRWAALGRIAVWWLLSPVVGFWCGAVVGRYLYPRLAERWHRVYRAGTERRRRAVRYVVVAVACYMAYSAGASNTANAVGLVVGAGVVGMEAGVTLAAAAIGVGAFTIAARTIETTSNDLTELPVLAALIVEVVSASIVTPLSYHGLPVSLAVTATTCIIGLGWGRASRRTDPIPRIAQRTTGRDDAGMTDAGVDGGTTPESLYDPSVTGRLVVLWVLTPSIAASLTFGTFAVL